mgnify:FL=1
MGYIRGSHPTGMFKCVNCGKEFNYLYANATEYNTYCFDGENYDLKEPYTEEIEYACPSCGKKLTTDEREARRLLKQA